MCQQPVGLQPGLGAPILQHRKFRIFPLKRCAMIASEDLTRKEKLEKLEADAAEPSSQKDSMMLVEVKDNLVLAFRHCTGSIESGFKMSQVLDISGP